jgi:hypothetical protein
MKKIDLIIDALSVAQNSVWSALNQEALAYAIELKLELAKPEQKPVRWFQQFGDAPPRKEWVGLTEDDMHTIRGDAFNKNVDDMTWVVMMARKIDFILKERNK